MNKQEMIYGHKLTRTQILQEIDNKGLDMLSLLQRINKDGKEVGMLGRYTKEDLFTLCKNINKSNSITKENNMLDMLEYINDFYKDKDKNTDDSLRYKLVLDHRFFDDSLIKDGK